MCNFIMSSFIDNKFVECFNTKMPFLYTTSNSKLNVIFFFE